MKGAEITVRSESDIYCAVHQQKAGPRFLMQGHRSGVENQFAARAAITGPRNSCRDLNRTGGGLVARQQIERMQPVEIARAIGRFRFDINCVRHSIDHRRAGDADLWFKIVAADRGEAVQRRFSGTRSVRPVDKARFPERRGVRVCVERVHAVGFGRNDHNVVSRTIDHDARNVERLSVNLPVDGRGKELAELIHIHIGRVENRLCGVLSTSRGVVMLCQNSGLPVRRERKCTKEKCGCDATVHNGTEIQVNTMSARTVLSEVRIPFPYRPTRNFLCLCCWGEHRQKTSISLRT